MATANVIWRTALVSSLALGAAHDAAAADPPVVKVLEDGRLASRTRDAAGAVTFDVAKSDTSVKCNASGTSLAKPTTTITYQWFPEATTPYRLSPDSPPVTRAKTPDGSADVNPLPQSSAPKANERYLIYNVLDRFELTEACHTYLSSTIADWKKNGAKARTTIKANNSRLKAIETELNSLKGIAVDTAVNRIVALHAEAETLRRESLGAKPDAERPGPVSFASDEDLAAIETNPTEGVTIVRLRRAGGVLSSTNYRAIFYDFAGHGEKSTLRLSVMPPWPDFHFGNQLFVVIANVVPADHPGGFAIEAEAAAGAPVNTAPARPTFAALQSLPVAPPPGLPVSLPKLVLVGEATAHTDVFLPVVGDFAPNAIITISVKTEVPGDTGTPEVVTVIDKMKLPQVRAGYRFNFNTGVIVSFPGLDGVNPTDFIKVPTVVDDPATPANEARYAVEERTKPVEVVPVFAFTYYYHPVDIQGKVDHGLFPTIGFSMLNPIKDFFIAGSVEAIRNVQVLAGVRFSTVDERLTTDAVDTVTAAPPVLGSKRRISIFFGTTFNLDVVTKIFK